MTTFMGGQGPIGAGGHDPDRSSERAEQRTDFVLFRFVNFFFHLVQPRPMNGRLTMGRGGGGGTGAPLTAYTGAEYDDPANCNHYNEVSQESYAAYTNTQPHPLPPPPPHEFGASATLGHHRRSVPGAPSAATGTTAAGRAVPLPPYPDPPQPPPPPHSTANHSTANDSGIANMSASSNNDSIVSAADVSVSEADICDREHLVNRNYGGALPSFPLVFFLRQKAKA